MPSQVRIGVVSVSAASRMISLGPTWLPGAMRCLWWVASSVAPPRALNSPPERVVAAQMMGRVEGVMPEEGADEGQEWPCCLKRAKEASDFVASWVGVVASFAMACDDISVVQLL